MTPHEQRPPWLLLVGNEGNSLVVGGSTTTQSRLRASKLGEFALDKVGEALRDVLEERVSDCIDHRNSSGIYEDLSPVLTTR